VEVHLYSSAAYGFVLIYPCRDLDSRPAWRACLEPEDWPAASESLDNRGFVRLEARVPAGPSRRRASLCLRGSLSPVREASSIAVSCGGAAAGGCLGDGGGWETAAASAAVSFLAAIDTADRVIPPASAYIGASFLFDGVAAVGFLRCGGRAPARGAVPPILAASGGRSSGSSSLGRKL